MLKELQEICRKTAFMSLNVSMIILILMPLGWGIIGTILVLEALLFYLLLNKKVAFLSTLGYLSISNLLSGLAGFGLSLLHNGGWYGVFWFPWISSHELSLKDPHSLRFFIIYFLIIFIITMIIEIPINILLFKKKNIGTKSIIRVSLLSNLVTNVGCASIIYLWSFGSLF